jgi:MFS family permease
LGGVLIAASGWRALFFAMVPVAVLGAVLVARSMPAEAAAPRRGAGADLPGADLPGTALLGLALAAFTLAVTLGGVVLALAAVAFAAAFLWVEARSRAPLVDLGLFRDRALDAGLAMNVLVAAVMMTTLVAGPFYLTLSLGLGGALVGAVMAAGPLISVLTGVPSGRLVDRLGTATVTRLGLAAMALGCVGFVALPGGVWGYLAAIAVLTPGYQLFQAANNTGVMLGVGPDRRGVVSGILGLSRNLGLIAGASAMGAVFAAAVGGDVLAAGPEAVAAGLRTVFAVAAGLMAVALGLSAVRPRRARDGGGASG